MNHEDANVFADKITNQSGKAVASLEVIYHTAREAATAMKEKDLRGAVSRINQSINQSMKDTYLQFLEVFLRQTVLRQYQGCSQESGKGGSSTKDTHRMTRMTSQ